MALEALLLFGSHARNDNDAGSDWDIIAVSDEGQPAYENQSLNICFYSKAFLLKISETGNLFALHIITEGQKIFDPSDILGEMRSRFRRKNDYHKDISNASMLGYFLLRHIDRVNNWRLFNKRVAWCVRTIQIASAYEKGQILFSSSALYRFFNNSDAKLLIDAKGFDTYDEKNKFRLARFLRDFGLGDPHVYDVDNIFAHIEYIFRSDNLVGKNTIASLFGAEHENYVFERKRSVSR